MTVGVLAGTVAVSTLGLSRLQVVVDSVVAVVCLQDDKTLVSFIGPNNGASRRVVTDTRLLPWADAAERRGCVGV